MLVRNEHNGQGSALWALDMSKWGGGVYLIVLFSCVQSLKSLYSLDLNRSQYRQTSLFPDITVANNDEVLVKSKLLVVLFSSRLLLL